MVSMGAVGELAFMGYGVSQGGSIPPQPYGPWYRGRHHGHHRTC